MCGVCSTSRSTSVVLPAPDGADTMKSKPARPGPVAPRPGSGRPRGSRGVEASLDILDLLAHLLELRLRRDDELRDTEAVGLGTHRVDLAVHLLQQEVELASARLRRVGQGD